MIVQLLLCFVLFGTGFGFGYFLKPVPPSQPVMPERDANGKFVKKKKP